MAALIKVQSSKLKVQNKRGFTLNRGTGFTLIELMVAISIIAILAAVGLVVYSTAQKSGRVSKRVQDLNAMRTAIELYKTAVGTYPIYNTGSGACISTSLAGLSPNYMAVLPRDPSQPAGGTTNCYWYFSDAAGNDYKIRTSAGAAAGGNSDMVAADYQSQPALIDPQRDATANCTIDAANNTSAWAFYTSGGCAY